MSELKLKLRECPFCGSKRVMHSWNSVLEIYEIHCHGCNCTITHWYGVVDEAIDAYNRRVGEGEKG